MARTFPDRIAVGRILRPHGLRGEVCVDAWSDVDDRFAVGGAVWLDLPGSPRRLTVRSVVPYKGGLRIAFEGVDDRDASTALRGHELFVERAEVPAAPDDTYYSFELIGCRCRDDDAGDLGEVTALIDDGGGLLLEVSDGARKLLIPFVRAFIRRIDIAAGEIDLDLPPGLVETCASTS